MVELSAGISNMTHNNLIVFDIAFYESYAYKYNKRENPDYKFPTILLKERPGLQRITYSSIFDLGNR